LDTYGERESLQIKQETEDNGGWNGNERNILTIKREQLVSFTQVAFTIPSPQQSQQ